LVWTIYFTVSCVLSADIFQFGRTIFEEENIQLFFRERSFSDCPYYGDTNTREEARAKRIRVNTVHRNILEK